MGLMDKIKNILFEEETVEIPIITNEEVEKKEEPKIREEKKEALLISSNVVYIKENYYFNSNDKEYLIYLKMIKDGKTIEDYNSYEFDNELNKDIDEIDKNTTYEFSKLIDIVIPK